MCKKDERSVGNEREETQTEIPDEKTMGGSVTDKEEQTDESSQTEKSDAENLQPQQDKLTPLSKPMGEGGEQGGRDVGSPEEIYNAKKKALDEELNQKRHTSIQNSTLF